MESGEIYSRRAMRKILNDNMVNKLFEFANQFNSLKLTDLEIAILCATRLTATGMFYILQTFYTSESNLAYNVFT
jgi:hypothetical protein